MDEDEVIQDGCQVPPHLLRQARELVCGLEGPRHVETIDSAGVYGSMGILDEFSLSKFRKNFRVRVDSIDPSRIQFDLIGINVAFANAFRRIMMAEVPTMAIETVELYQNTGVIQDEVLCHRLGLIPFDVEPNLFKFRSENEDRTADNSVRFQLKIICKESNLDPEKNCLPVYSRDLVWTPASNREKEIFKDKPPGPVSDNILITKLRPGQEIEATCYLEKGTGKTHAKWSPAAPASYRLQTKLVFPKGPLQGDEAVQLKELCPLNVFDIEDGVSVVRDARACTTCRACIERFPEQVEIRKIKDHFIFNVETTGSIPAIEIFRRALRIFLQKVGKLQTSVELQRTLANQD